MGNVASIAPAVFTLPAPFSGTKFTLGAQVYVFMCLCVYQIEPMALITTGQSDKHASQSASAAPQLFIDVVLFSESSTQMWKLAPHNQTQQ